MQAIVRTENAEVSDNQIAKFLLNIPIVSSKLFPLAICERREEKNPALVHKLCNWWCLHAARHSIHTPIASPYSEHIKSVAGSSPLLLRSSLELMLALVSLLIKTLS
jgi:hypothetical protein